MFDIILNTKWFESKRWINKDKNKIKTILSWKPKKNKNTEPDPNFTGS